MPPKRSPQMQTRNAPRAPASSQQQQTNPSKDKAPSTPILSQNKAPQPQNQSQLKKVTRRSSKPIINWFQRKLAGTVKTARRPGNGAAPRSSASIGTGLPCTAPGSRDRVLSAPMTSSPTTGKSEGIKMATMTHSRRKTISLNEGGEDDGKPDNVEEDDRSIISSDARDSTWSPASALEADEDASVRPIPPSAPPSPSPSRSSSSYLSDPRTFRSIAASTKPTTVLSVDLTPNGVAHIAQVPTTHTSQVARLSPHVRTSSSGTNGGVMGSGASITFSALPPSLQSSRPSSLQNATSVNSSTSHASPLQALNVAVTSVQAPLHTSHHPRNNPRPSSPPMDNASVLTLASSAFAHPGSRMGIGLLGWGSSAPSAMGGDSISQFEGITGDGDLDVDAENTSQYLLDEERDVDASVRALRPRSSRRGSWDSETSGWSARVGGGGAGTPSLVRNRSLWTANSIRTDGQVSAENGDMDEPEGPDADPDEPQLMQDDSSWPAVNTSGGVEATPTTDSAILPPIACPDEIKPPADAVPTCALTAETLAPKSNPMPLCADTQESVTEVAENDFKGGEADDVHSIAATDKEVWHSVPSTP